MPRRFIFKDIVRKPHKMVEADPKAIEWSKGEIEAMSEVSDADVEDIRAWLKRLGQKEALAAFDAEKK